MATVHDHGGDRAGISAGLITSVVCTVLSASVWPGGAESAPYPVECPALIAIPVGFLACWIGSVVSADRQPTRSFDELQVRSQDLPAAPRRRPPRRHRLEGGAVLCTEYIATVPDLLARHDRERADRIAYIDDGRAVTYGDLAVTTARLAGHLQEMGVEPGDRVLLYLDN